MSLLKTGPWAVQSKIYIFIQNSIKHECVCMGGGGGGLLGEGGGEVHKDKEIPEQANVFASWKVSEKC